MTNRPIVSQRSIERKPYKNRATAIGRQIARDSTAIGLSADHTNPTAAQILCNQHNFPLKSGRVSSQRGSGLTSRRDNPGSYRYARCDMAYEGVPGSKNDAVMGCRMQSSTSEWLRLCVCLPPAAARARSALVDPADRAPAAWRVAAARHLAVIYRRA